VQQAEAAKSLIFSVTPPPSTKLLLIGDSSLSLKNLGKQAKPRYSDSKLVCQEVATRLYQPSEKYTWAASEQQCLVFRNTFTGGGLNDFATLLNAVSEGLPQFTSSYLTYDLTFPYWDQPHKL
jgi:hypothetical protein